MSFSSSGLRCLNCRLPAAHPKYCGALMTESDLVYREKKKKAPPPPEPARQPKAPAAGAAAGAAGAHAKRPQASAAGSSGGRASWQSQPAHITAALAEAAQRAEAEGPHEVVGAEFVEPAPSAAAKKRGGGRSSAAAAAGGGAGEGPGCEPAAAAPALAPPQPPATPPVTPPPRLDSNRVAAEVPGTADDEPAASSPTDGHALSDELCCQLLDMGFPLAAAREAAMLCDTLDAALAACLEAAERQESAPHGRSSAPAARGGAAGGGGGSGAAPGSPADEWRHVGGGSTPQQQRRLRGPKAPAASVSEWRKLLPPETYRRLMLLLDTGHLWKEGLNLKAIEFLGDRGVPDRELQANNVRHPTVARTTLTSCCGVPCEYGVMCRSRL